MAPPIVEPISSALGVHAVLFSILSFYIAEEISSCCFFNSLRNQTHPEGGHGCSRSPCDSDHKVKLNDTSMKKSGAEVCHSAIHTHTNSMSSQNRIFSHSFRSSTAQLLTCVFVCRASIANCTIRRYITCWAAWILYHRAERCISVNRERHSINIIIYQVH